MEIHVRVLYLAGALVAAAAPAQEQRAVDYLAREAPRWSRENGCFSCHNNGDAARALYAAAARGYRLEKDALEDTARWLAAPGEWAGKGANPGFSDQKLANIQFAAALAESGAGPALKQAAQLLIADQDPDGSWHVDSEVAVGSPVTYGPALSTYLARRALRKAGFAEPAARATRWLLASKPHSILDAAALLLAEPSRRDCLDMILHAQSSDGGWGPRAMSPSEPFDTAVVLLALNEHEAAAIARGRAFLLATQLPAGGWRETTRPPGAQSYAQHISTSAWATLALVSTNPKR